MENKKFQPKSKEEEIEILIKDDSIFSNTKKYISPLISNALDYFILSEEKRSKLYVEILGDVPIAAERYLSSKKNIDASYKFSVYFAWYVAQHINAVKGLKRKMDVRE
ncbi:hypothetical protein KJ934_02275 [Patescibacteria group bacterium]|nr:hypothetical protein [Patescibacteria group bacterium]MBU4353595.1 hypothetical protein [Patescibacteria group bacterium]MBU4476896.1 hypothetical protein [Patescibacteria group bacterium]MCG2699083.1 hypothetical protein [Candidatus Parcubacteria bacterium]